MIRLGLNLSQEDSKNMTYDIIKLLTIFITYQILSYSIDNDHFVLDEIILKRIMYLIAGIALYHLVVKKIYSEKIDSRKMKKKASKA